MLCPACGIEVAEAAAFCHQCGTRIESGPDSESHLASPSSRASASLGQSETESARFAQRVKSSRDDEGGAERDLWRGGYCWRAMIGHWLLVAVGSLLALIAVFVLRVGSFGVWLTVGGLVLWWIGLYLLLLYRQYNVRYYVTTHRFVHEVGILRRVTDRIEVIDIDDVSFEQGVVDRVVGVGTIRLTTSDRTHPEVRLGGIDKVKEVALMIDDARRAERMRRGLHIEAI